MNKQNVITIFVLDKYNPKDKFTITQVQKQFFESLKQFPTNPLNETNININT